MPNKTNNQNSENKEKKNGKVVAVVTSCIAVIIAIIIAIILLHSCGGSVTPSYNVYFVAPDGANIQTQVVKEGECATKPEDPILDEYHTFDNWYAESQAFDFSSPINSDITLTAKYDAIVYTITYELDGGVNDSSNPTSYTYDDETIHLNPATKDYCYFLRWLDENDEQVYEIPAHSHGNITLKAEYGSNQHELNLYIEQEYISYPVNSTFGEDEELYIPEPLKPGFYFMKWIDQYGHESYGEYHIPYGTNHDIYLMPSFDPIIYSFYIDAAGGIVSDPEYTLYDNGKYYANLIYRSDMYLLPTPTREGYTFDGWYDGETRIYGVTFKPYTCEIDQQNITAHWTLNGYKVTLVLDREDASIDCELEFTYTSETEMIVPYPHAPGVYFLGWKDQYGEQNEDYKIEKGSSGDLTLTAIWDPILYGLYLYSEGGTIYDSNYLHNGEGQYNRVYLYTPERIYLPTPIKDGFTFLGWYDGDTLVEYVELDSTCSNISHNMLHAHWG